MEIVGYSERGLLNSLFYEIRYSPNNSRLTSQFLRIISFPYHETIKTDFDVKDCKVLIEQSFSDFGDSDSVLLIEGAQRKQSIFIEAKVKTFQRRLWSIDKTFKAFRDGIQKDSVSSSNLFTQLYFKHRLVHALQKDNENWRQMELDFPACMLTNTKKKRKIGRNKVVLKAVEILRQYLDDAYFVALIPDDECNLKRFYNQTLNKYKPNGFPNWDTTKWGYVSWKQVKEFCEKHLLKETQKVFEFNKGQIFSDD